MSIISENKKTVKVAQKAYIEQRKIRDKAAYETAKKRKESQNIRYNAFLEEGKVINEMLSMDTGEGLTAAEISRKMNGELSRHEVAGNLTAGIDGNSRYGINSNKIRTEQRRVVKHFIPCDENGIPLENAIPVKKETKVTIYNFKKGKNENNVGSEMVRQMFQKYQENNQ